MVTHNLWLAKLVEYVHIHIQQIHYLYNYVHVQYIFTCTVSLSFLCFKGLTLERGIAFFLMVQSKLLIFKEKNQTLSKDGNFCASSVLVTVCEYHVYNHCRCQVGMSIVVSRNSTFPKPFCKSLYKESHSNAGIGNVQIYVMVYVLLECYEVGSACPILCDQT